MAWKILFWLGALAAAIAPTVGSAAPTARFEAAIEQFVRANPAVPGIIVAVQSPRAGIDWAGARGFADRAARTPLMPSHAARIASVTKLYVSAAALRLAEEGRLDLAAPIAPLVDPATASLLRGGGYDPDRILVRHLMAHTSGLFDYAGSPDFERALMSEPGRRWTRRDQITLAMERGRPLGQPGETFGYSDTGYIILGEIIERATGRPLAIAVRELLGMRRLGLARSWWEDGSDRISPPALIAKPYLGPVDASILHPSFDTHGGGGLVATMPDVARFVRAAAHGRLFARPGTLVAALSVPAARREPAQVPYALMGTTIGIGNERCWGHTGFFGTLAFHCPLSDTTFAIHHGLGGARVDVAPLLAALADAAGVRAHPAPAR